MTAADQQAIELMIQAHMKQLQEHFDQKIQDAVDQILDVLAPDHRKE